MKAILKVGVPCLLLAALAPVMWSMLFAFGDEKKPIEADAAELPSTYVSAHLEAPVHDARNVLWCGTFQLAWNEVCTLVGEDLHFIGREPEMAPILNKKAFRKDDLDEESYLAMADYVGTGIHDRIRREMKAKFGGRAKPKALPQPDLTSHRRDIVAYAYLLKELEFEVPFEKIARPLDFCGTDVTCFGIDEEYKQDQKALCKQVSVIDYRDASDFIVELRTKSNGDRLILARMQPGPTLMQSIDAVRQRMAVAEPSDAMAGDVLKVPKCNLDITRRYSELQGARLALANLSIVDVLRIHSAVQNIRFDMDEKGVKLESDAHIVIVGCSASRPPERYRVMVFDQPFLIMLERRDATMPYFALWVGNADLLKKAGDD